MGHCYPIVSIDLHEKWYDGLKAGTCLGFWNFQCEETLPRDGMLGMGVPTKIWCVTARKRVTKFPKGLCSNEGKVGDIPDLVISISIWDEMHIWSVPWNNELVTIH